MYYKARIPSTGLYCQRMGCSILQRAAVPTLLSLLTPITPWGDEGAEAFWWDPSTCTSANCPCQKQLCKLPWEMWAQVSHWTTAFTSAALGCIPQHRKDPETWKSSYPFWPGYLLLLEQGMAIQRQRGRQRRPQGDSVAAKLGEWVGDGGIEDCRTSCGSWTQPCISSHVTWHSCCPQKTQARLGGGNMAWNAHGPENKVTLNMSWGAWAWGASQPHTGLHDWMMTLCDFRKGKDFQASGDTQAYVHVWPRALKCPAVPLELWKSPYWELSING